MMDHSNVRNIINLRDYVWKKFQEKKNFLDMFFDSDFIMHLIDHCDCRPDSEGSVDSTKLDFCMSDDDKSVNGMPSCFNKCNQVTSCVASDTKINESPLITNPSQEEPTAIAMEGNEELFPETKFKLNRSKRNLPTLALFANSRCTIKEKKQIRNIEKVTISKVNGFWYCKVCAIHFITDYEMRQHVTLVHGLVHCQSCSKLIVIKSFPRHKLKHKENLLTCPTCNKPFQTERTLDLHRRLKHGLTTADHQCQFCGIVYKGRISLQNHEKSMHSAKPPIKTIRCRYCKRVFADRSALMRHMPYHDADRIHRCSQCSNMFLTQGNLNKHIHKIHLTVWNDICTVCGKNYSSSYALKTHMRRHTGETPYTCQYCGDGFRQRVQLRDHHTKFCKLKLQCEINVTNKTDLNVSG